jgi:metallo-beta-lactamase family protein
LIQDPVPLRSADMVFMESTYGDRDHQPLDQTISQFEQIVSKTVWERQRLLIPAFAVGRMQSMVYYLAQLVRGGRVPRFPVYVDSPMAALAFEVYKRHAALYDAESAAIFHAGHQPLFMPDLTIIAGSEESKRLNTQPGAMVIMAASGMCTGGCILHHLKHNLWKRETQVAIVGYQAAGSLGRQLVDGASSVKIWGDTVLVRAKIHTLGGFSAHAGQSELLAWADNFKGGGPGGGWPRFVLTHGEPAPRSVLAGKLSQRGIRCELPLMGSVVEV